MQPPAGNTGCGVERGLRFRPAAKGRSALAGEDERQLLALVRALDIGREGVRKLACWLAQRYEMRNPVLGSRGWYRPSRPKVRPTSSSINKRTRAPHGRLRLPNGESPSHTL